MDSKEEQQINLLNNIQEEAEVVQPESAETDIAQSENPEIEAVRPELAETEALQPESADTAAAQPEPVQQGKKLSRREKKKIAKAQAQKDVKDLAREIREEDKSQKLQRKQKKIEDKKKYPTGKLRRKARRLRWKRERVRKRNELKNRYQDAPWLIRVSRVYLLKPFVTVMVLALILGSVATAAPGLIGSFLYFFFQTNKNVPTSKENIYKQSPIDKEGAKRINAVAPVGKDDTWTISVYIIGSNLEDMDENDLSQVVKTQVQDIQEKTMQDMREGYKNRLTNFSAELEKNELDIPAYLFYPEKPVKSDDVQEEENGPVVADLPGNASNDIDEMTSDTWSDNINIVIQPGGATRWSNSMVNPNRTQRFLYHKGVFSQVDDQPLQPAAKPETLSSFLNFCKENYPADHNMLILWDHGGGAFGYGSDSIFGDMMSLKDVREALKGAYEPNQEKPPFDIIGFDACLMSSLEVTHALNGFASYYAVSEETEPGDGWNYGPWLKAMTKDPAMSPPKVAQNIADSYMDYYMTQNVNIGWLITNDVTFSVLDASKSEELYQAWCELTKHQLIDAATDKSVLADMGRCSDKSTHFVSSLYNVYNTIDLGNYVDLMVDTYPEECSKIKKLIGESVMYHRENGSLSDSQGISVYMPGSVDSYPGLAYCLDYIYNICEDPSTRALYYYKIAGCLNEDMQKYLATLTKDKAQILDLKPFRQYEKTEPLITEDGFDIPIQENLESMLQSYSTEIAYIDLKTGAITNYGRDETVRLDGEGNVNCEFDGKWICYDGVPLATEVVAATDSSVEYRSKVLYNGEESYLSFTFDRDSEEFTINGIKGVAEAGGLFNEDPFNYLINTRMNTEVKKGDKIVPLYDVVESGSDDLNDNKRSDHGKMIKVSKRSKISIGKLPSGYYLTSAVISDQRGDVYYSQIVGNKVSGGKVKKRKVDPDFVGRDY